MIPKETLFDNIWNKIRFFLCLTYILEFLWQSKACNKQFKLTRIQLIKIHNEESTGKEKRESTDKINDKKVEYLKAGVEKWKSQQK